VAHEEKAKKKKKALTLKEFMAQLKKPITGKGLATNINTKKMLKKVDK